MLNRQNPTQTEAWASLESHFEQMKKVPLKNLFEADPNRFEHFTLKTEELLVDFSKNNITDKMKEYNVHESEWRWIAPDAEFNQIINNSGTLEDLHNIIKQLII